MKENTGTEIGTGTGTETRLQVLRELGLFCPEDSVCVLRCMPGSHILVEYPEDVARLIEGGYAAYPGPTPGGGTAES